MTSSKVLITGANGQLGRAVLAALQKTGSSFVVAAQHSELNITDYDSVDNFLSSGKFTHIVNCAAYTAVDKAEEQVELCNLCNIDGSKNLASLSYRHNVRLIHISTDYVFDGISNKPYSENSPTNPISVYGKSKLKGEEEVFRHNPLAIIIRTGWLYDLSSRNFLNTILRLAKNNKQLRVVSDQIGSPTFAGDLAEAISTVINNRTWEPGIFHYSNEGIASWYDFAVAILEECGLNEVNVMPIMTDDYPTAALRPRYSVLDKRKIKSTYGLQISHWRNALRRCLSTK